MHKVATKIRDAWLLQPLVHRDERGFFLETWNRRTFHEMGIDVDFVQDNHCHSYRDVLRGLHYQIGDAAQGKLVWVTSGKVFDVILDLRLGSPTFGVWNACELTAEGHECLWVPPGCAHGYLVTSKTCDFHYKCTKSYAPGSERAVRWNDPELAIGWPLDHGTQPIVSPKDQSASDFKDCEKY